MELILLMDSSHSYTLKDIVIMFTDLASLRKPVVIYYG